MIFYDFRNLLCAFCEEAAQMNVHTFYFAYRLSSHTWEKRTAKP